jgi:uncharacterized membrane protein
MIYAQNLSYIIEFLLYRGFVVCLQCPSYDSGRILRIMLNLSEDYDVSSFIAIPSYRNP